MAALLGAAILVALCIPPGFWTWLPDLCLFHRVTARPCPTCGLTRSWAALLHGDPAAAFRYHLLGPPLIVGLGLFLVWTWRGFSFGKGGRLLGWALAGLWIAYAAMRMAGWAPT